MPGMEGLLVQFMVMRLPSGTLVKQSAMDGNSMGLILEARNVHFHTHFSDLRVDALRQWSELTGYYVLGRTSQVHPAIYGSYDETHGNRVKL